MKEQLKKNLYNAANGVLSDDAAKQYAIGYSDGCIEGICVTAEELINVCKDCITIPAQAIVENLEAMLKKYEPHRIKWEVKK